MVVGGSSRATELRLFLHPWSPRLGFKYASKGCRGRAVDDVVMLLFSLTTVHTTSMDGLDVWSDTFFGNIEFVFAMTIFVIILIIVFHGHG